MLSGILLVLLMIVLVFAFFQKTEADAARQMAVQNEAVAQVHKAEADRNAKEAARQVEIANMARQQLEATLAECRAGKKK